MNRAGAAAASVLAILAAASSTAESPPAHAVGYSVSCEEVGSGFVFNNVTALPAGLIFPPDACVTIATTSMLTGLGVENFSNQSVMTTFDGSASTSTLLTSLPARLFQGASSLTTVHLPPNITSIGEDAFSGNSSLTTLTLPPGVASFGVGAFRGTGFTSFTVPSAVTSLPAEIFAESQLQSIALHPGVTSIGAEAFYRSRIVSVDLPDGMTTIPLRAFNEAGWLTSVKLPANLTTIDDRAFRFTALAGTLTMPSGVLTIGNEAFLAADVTTVVLNAGLEAIGARAFGEMQYLAGTLSIPASVSTLGDNIIDTQYGTDLRELTFLGDKPTMSNHAFSSLDASSHDSPRLTFTTGTSGWGDSGICGQTVTVSNYPFTGICVPTISSVSPSWIPTEGGAITITGTDFMPGATVSIDGVALSDASVTSSTTITATAPALSAGTRTLSVTNEGLRTGTAALRYGPPSSGGGAPTPSSTPEPTPSAVPTPEPIPTPPSDASGPTAAELRAAGQVRVGRVRALVNGVPPGESIVVVDDRKVRSRLIVGQRGMTVRTGPTMLGLQSQSARRVIQHPVDGMLLIRPAAGSPRDRARPAPSIQLAGSGNAPLTPLRAFLIPQPHDGPRGVGPQDLGYVMTDAEGRLQGSVPIRARKPGSYIVQVNGRGSDGVIRSINVPAMVDR